MCLDSKYLWFHKHTSLLYLCNFFKKTVYFLVFIFKGLLDLWDALLICTSRYNMIKWTAFHLRLKEMLRIIIGMKAQ